MKDKNITKQYNVFISGSDFGESGSGVLFYPGRETLFVFTCAHVVANHTELSVTLLKPVNISRDEYIRHIVTVPKEQIHYFPRDVSGNEEEHCGTPDIALLMFSKPKDFDIEPTRYCIGETVSDMPFYIQGYPHGIQDGTLPIENLDILNGEVLVSVPKMSRFENRITDNYVDRSNLVAELKGFSGGPVWKKNDSTDNQPPCLLGIISASFGETALNSRFFAQKAEPIAQFLKCQFDITIEKRLSDIPDEDVEEKSFSPAVSFHAELLPFFLSDNEAWIREKQLACRLRIDNFQLQLAIDVAREAIANPRFYLCNEVLQKKLMQDLLYCYEIGDLEAEFLALEGDMRNRHLVGDYDRRRHMTKTFMQKNYAETLKVAKACIQDCQDDKSLFFTAKAFHFLVGAYLEDLPEEQTIGKVLSFSENIIQGTNNAALIYQLIGTVYADKYADYKKAVRYINRAFQIGSDNIILESLGNAYYLLAISAATQEDGTIDPGKIDWGALYKAREIFLKVWQKADSLFWAGTMRRYGLQIYHTFFLYNDCYRVMALYPDIVKYMKPPKDVDENSFWRDIELKHAQNELLTGKLTVHPHLTQDDLDCLILEAEIKYCIQQLEIIMAERTYSILDLTGPEHETHRVITLFESRIQSIPPEKKLPFYVHIMTIYRYGILLFGWDKSDKLKDFATQIRTWNPSLEKMVRDCLYEIETPLDEVIRQAADEFEHNRDIASWNRLTQLYTRHAMLEKADEMYRMLFAEYPDLIMDEPEYFFRSYIDYITSYHRDLLDALQCFLDKEQSFHDLDVRNYIELELMSCSGCYNTPERFEVEPRPFVQKGVLTEEQYHRKAFIASLVNLKLEKAQELFDILRRYPHHVNPKTGNIIVPHQEEIHYLSLIGKIRPRNFIVPKALSRITCGIDSPYDAESWHVPISDSLKNRFSIESKISIDACGLYYLFQAHDREFLKRFETIIIPHLGIIHFLEDLSRTDDSVIRSILQFIQDNSFIVLQSPDFRAQVNVRRTIPYDEIAAVIALGMENDCLAVLGEPMLNHNLIDKYRRSFIRPNEIISLF